MTFDEWVGAAIALPVLGLAATWTARKTGKWLGDAIRDSMQETVRAIVSPDLQQVLTKVSEVSQKNASDHAEVSGRLGSVEAELAGVKDRLRLVEDALKLGAAAIISSGNMNSAAVDGLTSAVTEDIARHNPS